MLRSGELRLGQASTKSRDYLLVVTSMETNLSGGRWLRQLFRYNIHESEAAPLSLDRVFILSIDDFEQLMGAVAAGDSLEEIMVAAEAANESNITSALFFEQHLAKRPFVTKESRLVRGARIASERRLREALKATGGAERLAQAITSDTEDHAAR
jgi:hypothetical protein